MQSLKMKVIIYLAIIKTAIKNFKDELELRTIKYLQNHTSRTKLHSKTLTHLSAIVNFNKEHTPEDIKKVCDYLKEKLWIQKLFNLLCIEMKDILTVKMRL